MLQPTSRYEVVQYPYRVNCAIVPTIGTHMRLDDAAGGVARQADVTLKRRCMTRTEPFRLGPKAQNASS